MTAEHASSKPVSFLETDESGFKPVVDNLEAAAENDIIAQVVLDEFAKLPAKRKPLVRTNGTHEWSCLSGIVGRGLDGNYHCLSLATGLKCLPASKVPLATGVTLHDWHAEVLAIRAFNYFVLRECKEVALTGRISQYIRLRSLDERMAVGAVWHGQPFAWRDDMSLHMYSSEAPCGDASMELTMAAQDDAAPWEVLPPPPPGNGPPTTTAAPLLLPGRQYFSRLGVVRGKPGRGDAPPSLSKSCSDKLALKQCVSLLSSVASLLVAPDAAYLRSLVLPAAQGVGPGCARAFSPRGRMADVAGRAWAGGYAFRPFAVGATGCEFGYSKRMATEQSVSAVAAPSHQAAVWSANGLEESIVGGSLLGRKQFASRGASLVSRRRLWELARDVVGLLEAKPLELQRCLSVATYQEIKDNVVLALRRRAKEDVKAKALEGWIRNEGDSGFGLDAATEVDVG